MVDGLHILTWNTTNKPLIIALSESWRDSRGRDGGSDLTNVKDKPIWNYHNESPLYNKYILINNNNKKGKGDMKKVKITYSSCELLCIIFWS
jgi:hypothetical protein